MATMLMSLSLDSITILLGTNDGAGATTSVYNNLKNDNRKY